MDIPGGGHRAQRQADAGPLVSRATRFGWWPAITVEWWVSEKQHASLCEQRAEVLRVDSLRP